jgi:hypothetical protein
VQRTLGDGRSDTEAAHPHGFEVFDQCPDEELAVGLVLEFEDSAGNAVLVMAHQQGELAQIGRPGQCAFFGTTFSERQP